MKKILLMIVALPLLGGAMLVSLIAGVNMQGGLPKSKSWVEDIPVVGSFVKIRKDSAESKEKESVEGTEKKDGGEPDQSDVSPMVMVASRERLAELCEQVEAKLVELEEKERRLKEKQWRLEGGKKELKKQRERLLERVEKREKELKQLQKKIDASQKKLKEIRIKISKTEEENLKKTASVYGRMDTARAATILTEMFKSGKERTVVKILYLMRDRSAGGVLAELGDPKIGAQITEKLSHVSSEREGE